MSHGGDVCEPRDSIGRGMVVPFVDVSSDGAPHAKDRQW